MFKILNYILHPTHKLTTTEMVTKNNLYLLINKTRKFYLQK